jgi:chromate transporter
LIPSRIAAHATFPSFNACALVVILTRQAVTDFITAAIGLTTLALLWRFKVPEPYSVIGAGILGILLH